jgi:glutamate/aspartate transport system permease protein
MAATILVVEDEPSIQQLIKLNLEQAGYRVLQALDAEQASDMVRAELPHLVVLDWILPGQNGLEFGRSLRGDRRTQTIPIIMLSARVAEQVRTGIESLPVGQRMASTAVGMTTAQTYRYVLMPMVFRIIFPPLTSELLNTIKNTSVALTIGLMELTARARSMQEFSFQVFEAFTVATLLYLVTNMIVTILMRRLEKSIAVPGYLGTSATVVVH